MWQKLSASVGSATPDPDKGVAAQQPVPPPSVANKPAPGRTGPRGLAPRTTYTRVNVGAPPVPDAGTSGQKTQNPRGLEFLPAKVAHQEKTPMTTAMKRPQLHDLVKEAMAGTVSRVNIDAEANRQLANLGEAPLEKQASAAPPEMVPTEYLEKLAGAMDFAAGMLKQAEIGTTKLKPGEGPNAMQVLEAPGGENPVQPGNQGKATDKNTPPQNPPVQASGVSTGDPSNAMSTNDEMMHGEQPVEPISNEKASVKAASALYAKNLASLGLVKQALSISPEGHQYDAAMQRAKQQQAEKMLGAARTYEDESPVKGQLLGIGTGLSGFPERIAARRAAYKAGKHEQEQNPLNPFGGLLTKTPGEEALQKGAAAMRKQALAISPEGHAYDAAKARAQQQASETALSAARKYEDESPVKGQMLGIGTGLSAFPERLAARHAAYQAGKHEKGQNPLNPFGGLLTKTPGEEALQKGASVNPELYAKNLAALGLLKQAEDALNPAKVSGGAAEATGADPPQAASAAQEGPAPSEPSDVNSQKSMIGSNEAAINYKKVQAKKDPVSDMKDVVTEPGMSAAHDKTLNMVFDKTREAGAKIAADLTRTAAAQALLAKYAEGCSKKKTKEKQSQMTGMGGSMGMGNPGLPSTPAAATGQNTTGM